MRNSSTYGISSTTDCSDSEPGTGRFLERCRDLEDFAGVGVLIVDDISLFHYKVMSDE
jgi:hypothetical protein